MDCCHCFSFFVPKKKHRSWQKRSKVAPVDEDFSGAVHKPHSRRRRNKVAPAELEFSGAVTRRVENTVKSELAMMDMGGGNVQLMRVWPVQVRRRVVFRQL